MKVWTARILVGGGGRNPARRFPVPTPCIAARSLVAMKWSRSAKAASSLSSAITRQQHIGAHRLAVRFRGGPAAFRSAGRDRPGCRPWPPRKLKSACSAVNWMPAGRTWPAQTIGMVRDGCGNDLQSSSLKKRPWCDVRPVRHSLRSTSRYFCRIVVAIAEIVVAAPQAHLQVFELVPSPRRCSRRNRPLLMSSIVGRQ